MNRDILRKAEWNVIPHLPATENMILSYYTQHLVIFHSNLLVLNETKSDFCIESEF